MAKVDEGFTLSRAKANSAPGLDCPLTPRLYQKFREHGPVGSAYSKMGRGILTSVGKIHASMVMLWTFSAGEPGTVTAPVVPSKLKAVPTSPGTNVIPEVAEPLSVPTKSVASPSPGHQATMSAGGVVHGGGGFTVSTTFEL